jgi:hypothetical protein
MANNFDFNGKLLINSNGNVLIGTTTDSGYKLAVNGSQLVVGRTDYLGTLNGTAIAIDHSGINTWRIGVSDSNTSTFSIGNDTGGTFASKYVNITNAGNVGIGTSGPGYKLDVRSITTDPVAFFGFSQTASASNGLIKLNSGRIPQGGSDFSGESGIIFGHSGGTGGVNFDGQGGYIKSIRLNTYAASAQSDSALVFATSNDNVDAECMRITNAGNVLIGTTTDVGTKLNVNGVVNATDYYFNGTSSERVVKRYTAGINVAASGYTYIASVTGSSLASAVRMTIQGTSNGVVINVLADIQVNHFQDILVTTSSGFYTQLTIRIISNGNDVFSIEIEPVAAVNATTCYVEIYPLNDEVVSFSGSPQTAIPMTMTTRQGIYTAGVGGNSGSISAGGDIYVGENLGIGTINPGERLTLNSGSTTATSRFTNTTTGLDFRLGTDGVQSSYTNMVFYSDSGNAQIWKAGSTYTSQGGAASLNLYSSNGPISFHPNGGSLSNAMTISTSQNVLIGTTTDSGFKLRVNGSAKFDGVISADPGITSGYGTFLTGHNSSFQMTINANYSGGQTNTYTPQYAGASTAGMLIMKQRNGGEGSVDIYVKASGTDGSTVNISTFTYLMALDTNGKVGIGVSSPTLGLEVADGRGFLVGNSGSSGSMYVSPQDENTVNGSWGIANDTADIWLNYRGYQDGFSYFRDTRIGNGKGTAITYWNGDTGNMMIGTTTDSGYKLEVNGSFYSTSGVIQTATNDSEVLVLRNSGGNSGSVQGVTHLGINFFSVGTNSPVRITAYQNGVSGYAGGMYFSTRSANSDSAPVEAMRITHDQLIGLGPVSSFTTTHRVWIDKGSSTYAVYSQGSIQVNAGAIGVGVTPSATTGRIDAGNDIVAYSTSDSRLKENITPIANALDKVKSLTGVEFDWKEETKDVHGYEGHDVGVIAQEVQAVLPEAIRTNDTGYLSVRYEKMIALLIEGMKEQQNQIDELKAKLDGLTK